MNIGEVADRTGLPPKTIRYYESIGLIPPAVRTESGYRSYGKTDIDILRFVQRARSLGFSVKQVGKLLDLWGDQDRASADVKALALTHISEIDQKIAELQGMRSLLTDLTERCHGDDRPDCPILNEFSGQTKGSPTN